jgi:hypothetical protein
MRCIGLIYDEENGITSAGRITGHTDIYDLSTEDLCTINSAISEHTNISHA